MKTILFVFGTRPEAIKMAPLIKEMQKRSDKFKTVICVTAQHREMLDQVLDIFEIAPHYDLNIMEKGQDLFDITSKIIVNMRGVLDQVNPDIVLVHGDTTTSTATALAAFYRQIPVGHIEAGLRTQNIYSPWPEELNRQLTGRIAALHFAPTASSKQNLLKENVDENSIVVTGNTVIDALLMVLDKINEDSSFKARLLKQLALANISNDLISMWINGRKMVLITAHRRENFGDGFINIFKAIRDLAIKYKNVDFVFPMHLNPNVRQPITKIFKNSDSKDLSNVFLIEPLEYLPFVYLMSLSSIILTDSGGIQEEAPSLRKPVLVMRDTTERPEAVDAGTVKLVGTNYDSILKEVSLLLESNAHFLKMSTAINPYGDGFASVRIADALI